MVQQELFLYFAENHGILLTESEAREIEEIIANKIHSSESSLLLDFMDWMEDFDSYDPFDYPETAINEFLNNKERNEQI